MCSASATAAYQGPAEEAIHGRCSTEKSVLWLIEGGVDNFKDRCARVYRKKVGDPALEERSHVQLASVLSRIRRDRVCRNLTTRCASLFPQIVEELQGRDVMYIDAHVAFLVMVEGYRYAHLVTKRDKLAFERSFGWIDHVVRSTGAEKVAPFMLPSTGSHQVGLIQAFSNDYLRLSKAIEEDYMAAAEGREPTAHEDRLREIAKSMLRRDKDHKLVSWQRLSQNLLEQVEDPAGRALVERLCPEVLGIDSDDSDGGDSMIIRD